MKKHPGTVAVTLVLLFIFLAATVGAVAQQTVRQGPGLPANFTIDSTVAYLHRKINEYRQRHQLPAIPLSPSLCYVARLHARDLFLHHPDEGSCNFHSWSDKGNWTPFCYPADESKKNSVWDKPRELTRYPAKAFEIVYWENNPLVPDTVLGVWKTEAYFEDVLLNAGKWQGKKWNAVGVAIMENYASAWFGEAADPENSPPAKPAVAAGTVTGKDSIAFAYYIIIKTNLRKDSAERLAESLRVSGYPLARVLDSDGKVRLSAFESADRPTVLARLKEVKKTYRDAWLLKK